MFRLDNQARRPGFTLVELLVVIAIIGVLVGLTMVAVIPLLRKGPEVENKVSNIDQLSIAVTNFKNKYGFYPPDRIRLCRYRTGYGKSTYDVQSLSYLNAMWTDLDWSAGIDWDGGLNKVNPPAWPTQINDIWDLEGDQCLVFFLGGIPGQEGPVGFSTNKNNPAQLGGDRLSHYDFKTAQVTRRLIDKTQYYNANFPCASYTPLPAETPGTTPYTYDASLHLFPFFSYNDVYGQPYFYFSSGKRANGYNSLVSYDPIGSFSKSLNIAPYFESNQKYVNPDTFQIISAGLNGKFGGGGQWTSAGAEFVNADTKDNQANFHPHKLGVPGN